jgi:hypothetical protein
MAQEVTLQLPKKINMAIYDVAGMHILHFHSLKATASQVGRITKPQHSK